MGLKEILDRITEIIRCIQYANHSKEELSGLLQNLILLVGQVLVQRDDATEQLHKYNNQLWLSHITGQLDCPTCNSQIPIDFFVGSKGVGGKPMSAQSKEELIEKLEFPPITKEDLKASPIPDYMPDF